MEQQEIENIVCIPLKEIDPISENWIIYRACMPREEAIHWTKQFYSLE